MRRLIDHIRAATGLQARRGDLTRQIRAMMRGAPIPDGLLSFARRLFEDDAPPSRPSGKADPTD